MTENSCRQGGDRRALNERLDALDVFNRRTAFLVGGLEQLEKVANNSQDSFASLALRMGIAQSALAIMEGFSRALDECLGGLEEKSDSK